MNTKTATPSSHAMRMQMDPPSDTLRPVSGPTSRTTYDDGSEWRKANAQRSKEREQINTPWPNVSTQKEAA